jgi:hypothetical protein
VPGNRTRDLCDYYCIFPGFSRIQLSKLKYVVDRGILWTLEVALGQQKSAQACFRAYSKASNLRPVKHFHPARGINQDCLPGSFNQSTMRWLHFKLHVTYSHQKALRRFLKCRGYENYVKPKYHTSLLHEHLKSILITGTTKSEPSVEEILSATLFRTSQWWASPWVKYFCSAHTLMSILIIRGLNLAAVRPTTVQVTSCRHNIG